MESTNSNSATLSTLEDKHKIFIKDKHGVYFLQPFIDQNKKLLNIENVNVVIQSKNLVGVNKYSIKISNLSLLFLLIIFLIALGHLWRNSSLI